VLLDVLSFAQAQGCGVLGLTRSPLLGPKGNSEFLAWLTPGTPGTPIEPLVDKIVHGATS
jgi:hypothetical protein